MKGITNPEDQKDIIYTMINEFNEMLIQLANFKQFPNLFHIDCRGTAKKPEDWYDELHLKSYESIASTYKMCIKDNLRMSNPNLSKKVYKVN